MPLAGRDVKAIVILRRTEDISIHAPLAGRDSCSCTISRRSRHFNPRAPCGARPGGEVAAEAQRHFNPRAPCGARLPQEQDRVQGTHFNPRAPCGARPFISIRISSSYHFNPRAPCGARLPLFKNLFYVSCISIHAPLAGRDLCAVIEANRQRVFQSTRPLRGATTGVYQIVKNLCISIHAPLAGRDVSFTSGWIPNTDFNPRAPCGARPGRQRKLGKLLGIFQSTRPLRGATVDNKGFDSTN